MSRIIGHFDGIDGTRAAGWIADAEAPERVLSVALMRIGPDGQSGELGRARANRAREDLRAIGLIEIRHGFEWRVPFLPPSLVLAARSAEDGGELPGSPVVVTPRTFYEGTFDGIDRGVLRGWAWGWDPSLDVTVEVFVDGQRRGSAPARTERPDLVVAGIGSGRHGFAWVVPDEFADGRPHEFACRIGGTDVWLAGTPQTAIIRPGDRSHGLIPSDPVRGFGRRPRPAAADREGWRRPWRLLGRGRPIHPLPTGNGDGVRVGASTSIMGEFRCPALPCRVPSRAAPAADSKGVRLLIPMWGEEYLGAFCRTVLPSLLSPNNLPYLACRHPLTVTLLTRRRDRALIEADPACRRLAELATIGFIDIDDILSRSFDQAPGTYPTALTWAFFRGIRAAGSAACRTDFIFWDADFIAADGVFRTLSELIAAGVRCTLAPSLRVDRAIAQSVLGDRLTEGGTVLDIGPREWVELATRFPHPTVMAQTANHFAERMIDTVNQLYWRISNELTVGRVFLMFMLHIRPEHVWEEVYGHCDYVFVPEMVPSGHYHFETRSDRLLIIELQRQSRESGEIVFGDSPMTPAEVARGVGQWTTREHRLASRHLAVFNSAPVAEQELASALAVTDAFMDEVYRRLPEQPVWHNGHFFWKGSMAALGLPYDEPGPDHPRSHLAAALRWTGYDIDILRESWPAEGGPPAELFAIELPLAADFEPGAWLARVRSAYASAWRAADPGQLTAPAATDLISGHFHGVGWGLVGRGRAVEGSGCGGWTRSLGADGRAVLLLRLPPGRGAQVRLFGVDRDQGLRVSVGGAAMRLHDGSLSRQALLRVDIPKEIAERGGGRVEVELSAPPAPAISLTAVEIRVR